jgi:hypothetical protein
MMCSASPYLTVPARSKPHFSSSRTEPVLPEKGSA